MRTSNDGRAKMGNGASLGFEAQLFLAADKLRKNLEPSDYKHVVLGLIFLKHISNSFEAKHAELSPRTPRSLRTRTSTSPRTCSGCPRRLAGRTCRRMRSRPRSASSSMTQWQSSRLATQGLKGVLPKIYNSPSLDKVMLGELIDLVSTNTRPVRPSDKAKDILGRVLPVLLPRWFRRLRRQAWRRVLHATLRREGAGRDVGAFPRWRPGDPC